MYCHPSRRPSTEHRKAGCSPIRFYSANTDCHHSHFTNITVKHWRVLTVTKRCPLTVKIIPIVIDSYFESTMNRKTTRSTLPSSVAQSRRRPSMCISSSWGVSVVIGPFLLLLLSSPRSFCHAFTPSTRTILVPTYSSRPPSTNSLSLSNPSMPRIQQSPSFPSTPSHYFPTCLHASNKKNNYDQDEIGDWNLRLKCCFPYLLPLLDGNHFGYFLFQRIPLLGQITLPSCITWTLYHGNEFTKGRNKRTLKIFPQQIVTV